MNNLRDIIYQIKRNELLKEINSYIAIVDKEEVEENKKINEQVKEINLLQQKVIKYGKMIVNILGKSHDLIEKISTLEQEK